MEARQLAAVRRHCGRQPIGQVVGCRGDIRPHPSHQRGVRRQMQSGEAIEGRRTGCGQTMKHGDRGAKTPKICQCLAVGRVRHPATVDRFEPQRLLFAPVRERGGQSQARVQAAECGADGFVDPEVSSGLVSGRDFRVGERPSL